MSERPGHDLSGLEIDLARRIDAVCRRYEDDWRGGRQPCVRDYLDDIPEEGRAALRAELEALERELRQANEIRTLSESGPIAEAPTIAPCSPPTAPIPGLAASSVHEEATVPPREQATIDLGSSAPPPDASGPARVRYFGDYEIESELARGGMGVVFLARQISLNRPVALKMILAGQLADETDVKRFYTEAEAAANLDHPGIVPIYEVGQHEGQHYFSMGYVDGQSLAQRLAAGPLPPREAAALMVKVAEAIDYAHRRGVIHRDLKPGNILLDPSGNPRVTDFGLAKRLQSDSGLTGSGQIMGTPSYMPPEQAGGNRGEVGPAADVYALGATLYALITGRPPFQAATAMDTVLQVIGDEPVPPRRLNASVPLDLETICLKCLEKEPGKRYAAAAALAEDLGRYLAGEPIVARPVTRSERAWKWVRRRPLIASLVASVVVIGLLGLTGIIWQWREAVAARTDAQTQARIARENESAALAARGEAQAQAQVARDEAESANRRLYDVKMNVVQQAWETWNPRLFVEDLEAQRPGNQRGVDRRGFEWYYWRRKLASGHGTLKAESAGVLSVAFSPDGSRIAAACGRGTVKVWDVVTGREVLTFKPHAVPISQVVFSPDGSRIATVSEDGTAKVCDAAAGRPQRTLKGRAGALNSLAFSPDGLRIATTEFVADKPGLVQVWQLATGQPALTLRGHTREVTCVAFSPDGSRIAAGGRDATVRIWDAMTAREMRTIKGHTGEVASVAFSPDGSRLASAGGRWSQRFLGRVDDGQRLADDGGEATVEVWDTTTGQQALTLQGHPGIAGSVAFSRDGRRIASAGDDGTVRVWDAATGRQALALNGHTAWVTSVAFSPDGSRLASASLDDTVRLWDLPRGQDELTLAGQSGVVRSVAFSPDGSRLASAGGIPGKPGEVKVWDAATGRETLGLKGSTGEVRSVAFSPDGLRLAAGDDHATIKIWDAATGREARTLAGHAGEVTGVAFSPDGRRLASAGVDGTVRVWDAATGREALTVRSHTAWVTSVAFSPDGSRFASAGADRLITFFPMPAGQRSEMLKSLVLVSTMNVDGVRMASASFNGSVKVWDATTGREALTITGLVMSVAFDPRGSRIAASGFDGAVKVWDAATGRETLPINGHTGAVLGVAFSPDGSRLASAGVDQTLKLWDTATGQETLTLKGHTGWVRSVSFGAGGQRLASAGHDGTIKIWDARPLDDEPARPGPNPR
jgi:WD40 repeat protein